MIIQHNIPALNSYNKLATNNSAVQKNLEKLSSGYRINRAGDDAAGLAISEKMRAQITGLERAKSNAQDGISLVQTGEGALTEVHSMLNRLVELGTESANGIYQADDRSKIQDEVNQITDEIDRISDATNFNGINLLDGSLSTTKVANGVQQGDFLSLDGGTLEIDVKKDQQVKAATSSVSKFASNTSIHTAFSSAAIGTAATTNYVTVDVRYLDEAGTEQVASVTINGATQTAYSTNLATAITNKGIGLTATGGAATFTASATSKGASGAKMLGITVKETGRTTYAGTDGKVVKNPKEVAADKTKTVTGKNEIRTNQVAFKKDLEVGQQITIGDKTYEIADEAGVNKVKAGNVAVVLGKTATGIANNTKTLDNLVNALIANGVDARTTNTARTIGIDNLSQISIKKAEIQTSVNSNGLTVGAAASTKGGWSVEIGVGAAVNNMSLTVKYLNEEGKEQTRTITYSGTAAASTNAEAMKAAIAKDEVLNKLFKAERADASGLVTTAATATNIKLTSIASGSKGAQIKSITTSDVTATAITKDSLRQSAKGIDAGKGFSFNSNLKENDTLEVAGQTFQFVSQENVSKIKEGNIAVVMGKTSADTAKNFNEALKDAGFATAYEKDSVAVRVIENDFSLQAKDAEETGGLTLQIGDTADAFNKVTVSVDNMSSKGLGINDLKVTDQGIAADSIEKVKSAIEKVSVNRGRLGALQNRLEHTISNLATTTENMTAAESRIRDTDMAKEMMHFTKNNVLVQAAQSMLSQANQQPQQVLQLLR